MKFLTHIFPILLFLVLEGCATIDPAEFFHGRKYESDKPFRMKGANLDAPLLSKKGDGQISVNMLNGFGMEGSVAVSNHFGLLVNGSHVSGNADGASGIARVMITNSDLTTDYRYLPYTLRNKTDENSCTAGLIHFNSFGTTGRSEQIAGITYGSSDCFYDYTAEVDGTWYSDEYYFTENRKWFQYFLQQNLGFVASHAEGALMARISYMRFHEQGFSESYPVDHYTMDEDQWVFQPGLKLGTGWHGVRFTLQCNFNIAMGGDVQWYSTQWQGGINIRLFSKKSQPTAIRTGD